MTNLDATKDKKNELYNAVTAALASGNEEQIKAAVMDLQEFNKAELKAIYNEYEESKDEAVLESRGIKALTSEETKFWNSFIADAKRQFGIQNSASDGVYTGIMELLPKTDVEKNMENAMMVNAVVNITGVEKLMNIVVKDANLNMVFVNQHQNMEMMNLNQVLARLNG